MEGADSGDPGGALPLCRLLLTPPHRARAVHGRAGCSARAQRVKKCYG
jgi:hypothetical protein